jgi:hypothetical protein
MIKKTLLVVVGAVAGMGVGYKYHAKRTFLAKEERRVTVQEEAKRKAAPIVLSKEQLLLISAIYELDLKPADRENAKEYLNILELNTKRYDWLIEKIVEANIPLFHLEKKEFKFSPDEEMVKFMGWNDKERDAVREISVNTSNEIAAWEKKNAKLIEAKEKSWSYEIPEAPKTIEESYFNAIQSLLSEDDIYVLTPIVDAAFSKSLAKKIITVSFLEPASSSKEKQPLPLFKGVPQQQPEGSGSLIQVKIEYKTGESTIETFPKNEKTLARWGAFIPKK